MYKLLDDNKILVFVGILFIVYIAYSFFKKKKETNNSSTEITESSDLRSYRVNSEKVLSTGFRPKKGVEDAIQEIIESYNSGILKDEDKFHNLKWMQTNALFN